MRIIDILSENASDYEIHNYKKLDKVLLHLCKLVLEGQKTDPEKYGMVAAALLDTDNNIVTAINTKAGDKRSHAERNVINKYLEQYGDIPDGSIIVTTLSPCNEHEDETAQERFGISCTDLINQSNVKKVYCGFIDPTQHEDQRDFTQLETENSSIRDLCKKFASTFLDLQEDTVERGGITVEYEFKKGSLYVKALAGGNVLGSVYFINYGSADAPDYRGEELHVDERYRRQGIATIIYNVAKEVLGKINPSDAQTAMGKKFWGRKKTWENFADGQVKGKSRPGRVKRAGASCDGSVTDLRARAKKYGGEKGKMYHWCANMKAGKNK